MDLVSTGGEREAQALDVSTAIRATRRRSEASRQELMGNIADLFLPREHRLSDRERSVIYGILERLIDEIDTALREALSERLHTLDTASRRQLAGLAEQDGPVARAILEQARVLEDPELIAIIRQRGREHALAIAARRPLSADVGDALIATGDEDVIECLVNNPEAELSRAAMTYLVAEAQRLNRFQEPLLRRHDLPADLAMRLYWLVSAAWRRHILESFDVAPWTIDQVIQEAAGSAAAGHGGSIDEAAGHLAESLAGGEQLTPDLLLRLLAQGHVPACVAGLARLARLDERLVRHVLIDARGESLAVLARATGFSRVELARLLELSRRFVASARAAEDHAAELLAVFDRLSDDRAEAVLSHWRRDRGYVAAITRIDTALGAAGAPAALAAGQAV